MNVVLNPIGSHGDVHPFVGLGIELSRRGHDVTVVTNAHFRDLIQSAGLRFSEVGTDDQFRELAGEIDLWHPKNGPRVIFGKGVFPYLDATIAALRKAIVPGETIVVSGSLGLGARLLQDLTGVPHVTVHLSPLAFRSVFAPPKVAGFWLPPGKVLKRLAFWLADAFLVRPIITRPLNAYRAKLGLAPVKRVLRNWLHSPLRVVGAFPEWFCPMQADWPPQAMLTGFPLYDERGLATITPQLRAFLQAGPPPIAFTPGSAMVHGRDFFIAAIVACRKIGRRGILLTRHGEQLPDDLPQHMIHIDYAPFSELLPHCAALVHHGGIGTTSQGLAAGLPQVIMPMAHDQPDNAARLIRLGVGAQILPRQFNADTLAGALQRLLEDDAVRCRAKELAQKIDRDAGLRRLGDVVEKAFAHASSRIST
jgi:UDP:flavonoid glycosyltransferase YjiC (YdhE family)